MVKRSSQAAPAEVLDVIGQLRGMIDGASPVDRAVAETILKAPERAAGASIGDLAREAGVSPASVTRLARRIGFDSFQAFKLRLAQAQALGAPYLARTEQPQETTPAHMAELVDHVFDVGLATLEQARTALDPETLAAAVDTLARAGRIEIFAVGGGSGSVGFDADLRFFRLGIPAASRSDGHVMRMAACALRPGDAVLAISQSGETEDVIAASAIAREYGAQVIALAPGASRLSALADIRIRLGLPEHPDILKPTAVRLAYMMAVDVLATGLARRLGDRSLERLRRIKYHLKVMDHGEEKT